MWDVLPIMCEGMDGPHLGTIEPSYPFPVFSEVLVKPWKDVPEQVKEWAFMIWKEEFGSVRIPLDSTDLFAWIPAQATLIARKGYWNDYHKTKPMCIINWNYVHPEFRGYRLAEKTISTLCAAVIKEWEIDAFLFEVETIPVHLKRRKAKMLSRFDYLWVPNIGTDPDWVIMKQSELHREFSSQIGFHTKSYTGCLGYRHSKTGTRVLLDSHDDVMFYDSFGDIGTIPGQGRFCRVFHPYGSNYLFVQNMYFTETYPFVTLPS